MARLTSDALIGRKKISANPQSWAPVTSRNGHTVAVVPFCKRRTSRSKTSKCHSYPSPIRASLNPISSLSYCWSSCSSTPVSISAALCSTSAGLAKGQPELGICRNGHTRVLKCEQSSTVMQLLVFVRCAGEQGAVGTKPNGDCLRHANMIALLAETLCIVALAIYGQTRPRAREKKVLLGRSSPVLMLAGARTAWWARREIPSCHDYGACDLASLDRDQVAASLRLSRARVETCQGRLGTFGIARYFFARFTYGSAHSIDGTTAFRATPCSPHGCRSLRDAPYCSFFFNQKRFRSILAQKYVAISVGDTSFPSGSDGTVLSSPLLFAWPLDYCPSSHDIPPGWATAPVPADFVPRVPQPAPQGLRKAQTAPRTET